MIKKEEYQEQNKGQNDFDESNSFDQQQVATKNNQIKQNPSKHNMEEDEEDYEDEQEEVQSSMEAEEEDDYLENDDDNQYQEDGFVVNDENDDGEEEDYVVQTKKNKKRKLPKEYNPDEEDLEIANQGKPRKKKNRLKKNNNALIQQQEIDFDDDGSQSFIESDNQNQDVNIQEKKEQISNSQAVNKYKSGGNQKIDALKQVFGQIEIEQEEGSLLEQIKEPQSNESQEVEGQIKPIDIQNIIEPECLDELFTNEEDQKIINTDQPERLQIRYKNRDLAVQNELAQEAKWIFEKFKEKKHTDPQKANIYWKKIHQVLEFLRIQYFEVMYIITYKEIEYKPELEPDDIWLIYDLDNEWATFSQLKQYLEGQMQEVMQKTMDKSQNIHQLLESSTDINTLNDIREYIDYTLSKIQSNEDEQDNNLKNENTNFNKQQKMKYKQPIQHNEAREIIQTGLADIAQQVVISPDQLADNILSDKNIIHFPLNPRTNPEEEAMKFENKEISILSNQLNVLNNLCKLIALDLFHNPLIRRWVQNKYLEYILISTEPTSIGAKKVDIHSYFYPVKRINKRQIRDFTDETWILLLQAEKMGLITYKIQFTWELNNDDGNKKNDDVKFNDIIHKQLNEKYVAPINSNMRPEDKDHINRWNILRVEALRIMLKQYMYPHLEKQLKNDLQEISEKFIIKQCTKKFKELLMTAPYQVIVEEDKQELPNCVMSIVLDSNNGTENGQVGVVFLDKQGQVKEYIILESYARGSNVSTYQNINPMLRKQYIEDKEKLKCFIDKYVPDLIVVAANCISARRIKREMLDLRKQKQWVTFGDDTIPQMYAKSKRADQLSKDVPHLIRVAISLGRMKQNPMAEILGLWNENSQNNMCLNIPLNVLQKEVNRERLKQEFEKAAIEVVNSVGVDINDIIDNQHLEPQLQFISGLGPRKAKNLLMKINEEQVNENQAHFTGPVVNERRELFQQKYLEKNVFSNCCGFIKIIGTCRIDQTRIHNENYGLAVKICQDALEDDKDWDKEKGDKEDAVKMIMEKPQKLEELDFEDYAKHLAQVKKKDNQIYLLNFIKNEFVFPFQDPRQKYKEMSNTDLFYKLTKESPQSFKKYMIVTCRIEKILQEPLKLFVKIIGNNLKGSIFKEDLEQSDINKLNHSLQSNYNSSASTSLSELKGIDSSSATSEYKVGGIISTFVKHIKALENNQDKSNQTKHHEEDILQVQLSLKNPSERDWQSFLNDYFPDYDRRRKTFQIVPSDDFPKLVKTVNKKVTYTLRKINHPKFRNMSLNAAVSYIKDQQIGDFIIRSSSSGPKILAITWKFFENVIAHLQVKEIQESNSTVPKYLMNNEIYDSLDEIIEKHIYTCNNNMEIARNYKKFLPDSMDEIKERLRQDHQSDANIIHYYYGCFPSYPQFIVLLYMPKDELIVQEFIKVKQFGFFFHEKYFQSLKELTVWFKSNYVSDEYKKYVRRAKAPIPIDQDKSKQIQDSWKMEPMNDKKAVKIKLEGGYRNIKSDVKNEEYKSSQMCATCGKYGHTANECKSKKPIEKNKRYESYDNSSSQVDSYKSSYRKGGNGDRECYKCHSKDHLAANCPNNQGSRIVKCFSCDSEGHMAKDCPNNPNRYQKGGYGGNNSSQYQYKKKRPYGSGSNYKDENNPDSGNNPNNGGGFNSSKEDTWGTDTNKNLDY